jgi:hypothetical protein
MNEIDVEKEMIAALAQEITAEIDQEICNIIRTKLKGPKKCYE